MGMGFFSDLVEVVHAFHARGWSPATSTNYSVREPESTDFWVSRSGVDKSKFTTDDFVRVNAQGQAYDAVRPSAETALHAMLYRRFGEACGCVLHTHSALDTVLSMRMEAVGGIEVANLEILKGLRGITTHATQVRIAVFANSQDMPALAAQIEAHYAAHPASCPGFLLAGHGLYAWGVDVAEAKRHVEVFEFLLHCLHLER